MTVKLGLNRGDYPSVSAPIKRLRDVARRHEGRAVCVQQTRALDGKRKGLLDYVDVVALGDLLGHFQVMPDDYFRPFWLRLSLQGLRRLLLLSRRPADRRDDSSPSP